MKVTGIVRKLDELGRLTIPKEIRRQYGINYGDSLDICAGTFEGKPAVILVPHSGKRICAISGECIEVGEKCISVDDDTYVKAAIVEQLYSKGVKDGILGGHAK